MENISILAQLIVALSVIIVWVFRYENIVLEFKQYGLSSLVRNAAIITQDKTSFSGQCDYY